MDDGMMPFLLGGMVLFTFWMFVICYGLYRLGRKLAVRYRSAPRTTLGVVALVAGTIALPFFLLPTDPIWRCVIVSGVWITLTWSVGGGFWGGLELGKRDDAHVFWQRTEEWLKEWEQPLKKKHKDDGG